MFKKRKKGSAAYGIIGLGRFGTALAKELIASGADTLVMDRNEEKVREMREQTENALVIRNLDKNSLLETGIQNCDVAVLCVGGQLDISILTTLHLVSMGIPRVISKASSSEHGEILRKLGAEVVYPEREMAIRLAHLLETPHTLDFVQLSERINFTKLTVPEAVVGRSVVELDLRKRLGLNIIAIENAGEVSEIIYPEYVFRPGDILYVIGSRENIGRLAENETD